MRGYVARLLASEGWEVEAVADGRAALAAARRHRPDLVLADVMMPRLGGLGLVAALREEAGLAEVPVVLLSARAGEEARVEGLEAGADDYVTKPIVARELLARVRSNLALARLRREAAARVRRSEARLQAAVDLVGLAPYSWDPATGALEWDDRLRAMWGLPPGAPVDTEVFLAGLHPEDRPRVEAAIARCTDPAGDGVYALEYRVIGIGDGIERWVATYGRTFFEDGRAVGFVGAALDVTERKRAEARLRASEERFRQLADLAPAFIWFSDADGGVRHINARWHDYTGQTPEEALDHGTVRAVHPDDVAPMFADWEEASRRGVPFENEFRCRRRDGAYRWHRGRVEPLRDGADRITGWFGAATDVHDRKLAEAALQESEERFRLFAEHSTNVLWMIDAGTGRVEYLSAAYERVWGEPAGVLLGRHWDRWAGTVHPDDRDAAGGAMARVLRGEVVAAEYRIVRPDGAVRWVRDTFFPVRDARGTVLKAAGIAQDVTAHEGSLVYLVDGSEASRRDLALLLRGGGYDVKAFASARALRDVAPALAPGCVLLDARGPEAGGPTVPRELRARRVDLPVVVLGEGGGVGPAVRAMKAGAADFVEMPCEPEALLAAVASALADIKEAAADDRSAALARERLAGLSGREREVLDGLLAGGTNKTIAKDLGISPRTVEVHRAHLMERLGARTLPEAVLVAAAAGVRPPRQPPLDPDAGAAPRR